MAGILLVLPIIFLPEPKRAEESEQAKLAGNGEKVKIPAGVWVISLFLCHNALSLFSFFVKSVLLAESAVLLHFDTVRVVFLVFHSVVVSLLALCTC